MIGGHILLQIDVIEHRRLGIGGTHHDSSPPGGAFSYHTYDGRRRGFVNNLLREQSDPGSPLYRLWENSDQCGRPSIRVSHLSHGAQSYFPAPSNLMKLKFHRING